MTQVKGVRKKCLPEPNPSKVEVEVASTLLDIKQKAKQLFFYCTTHPDDLVIVDSSGVPIVVTVQPLEQLDLFFKIMDFNQADIKCTYVGLKVSTVIYYVVFM